MRILGIDPGYATTGFGVLDAERGAARQGEPLDQLLARVHRRSFFEASSSTRSCGVANLRASSSTHAPKG